MQVRAHIREATARLEENFGPELANKFQGLLYRIILNLNTNNKEFFAARRRLITSHGHEAYEEVGEYRKLSYMQPDVARLWRAAYAFLVEEWYTDINECANYYMVSVDDFSDLVAYWHEHGKSASQPYPDLYPADDRQSDDRVTPDKIAVSAEGWSRIRARAWSLIKSSNYQYLTRYGYFDEDSLVADVTHYGICRMMLQDWLPEEERFKESFMCMRSYLCDIAKAATAKKRARAAQHFDREGNAFYTTTVINIEDMVMEDGHHPLERMDGESKTTAEIAEESELLERLLGADFNDTERRILNALLGNHDAEIDEMMEGEEITDWLEWLCGEMDVDFTSFSTKALRVMGVERELS